MLEKKRRVWDEAFAKIHYIRNTIFCYLMVFAKTQYLFNTVSLLCLYRNKDYQRQKSFKTPEYKFRKEIFTVNYNKRAENRYKGFDG